MPRGGVGRAAYGRYAHSLVHLPDAIFYLLSGRRTQNSFFNSPLVANPVSDSWQFGHILFA